MGKLAQELLDYEKRQKRIKINDNMRKIWDKIDGSTVYYVKIDADCNVIVEDKEGITFKKIKNSLIFTHEKTKIEIPITNNMKISEYPGGSAKIPDYLGISLHVPDSQNEVSIEFSAGKSDQYYKKLKKRIRKG